ncbi:unannotated protein [freshwater metagenome]|uniref:Unannotated protein n=1 Tax=freshwater metagenome TaxID=449393 RepID=A0A6J7MSQ6_9ZZZZ
MKLHVEPRSLEVRIPYAEAAKTITPDSVVTVLIAYQLHMENGGSGAGVATVAKSSPKSGVLSNQVPPESLELQIFVGVVTNMSSPL